MAVTCAFTLVRLTALCGCGSDSTAPVLELSCIHMFVAVFKTSLLGCLRVGRRMVRQYIAWKRPYMASGPLHTDASALLSQVSEEQMQAVRTRAKPSPMVASLQRICPRWGAV